MTSLLFYSSELFHSDFMKKFKNSNEIHHSSLDHFLKSILPTLFTTPIGLDLYLIGDEMEFYNFSQLLTKHFGALFEAQQFPNVFLGILVKNSTMLRTGSMNAERTGFLVEALRRIPNLKGWMILHDRENSNDLLQHAAVMFQHLDANSENRDNKSQLFKTKTRDMIAVMKANVIVNNFPNIRKNVRMIHFEKLNNYLNHNQHDDTRINTHVLPPFPTLKIENLNVGRIWYGTVKYSKKPFLYFASYHEMAMIFNELLSSPRVFMNTSISDISDKILDKYGIHVMPDDRFEASELKTLVVKPGHLTHHQFHSDY
ncbi:hypothetical protein C9374_012210 [Naegleria lovaniensis]|uniref:Uncharacterized protein n=1 Tax=Naegleria lovaniensis TaxID=51637 RepID=A0AA88GCW9_NAELO|nr:uncharacterized protein C9374_012210 [Naegleria lovaniensis]KAG2373344.1 hypothetical protein C9374_012210 [Naegleria lovaniensis]